MPWKLRLIMIVVKLVVLPITMLSRLIWAIQWLSLWMSGRTLPGDRLGMTLYHKTNSSFEFIHIVEFKDQILEQRGNVGQKTLRRFVPVAERDAVIARIDGYLAEGFVSDEDYPFDYIEVAAPVDAGFADGSELELRNALWDKLDAFLADTGLGTVVGASSGSGSMELEVATVDADLAAPAITDFINSGDFTEFAVEAEEVGATPAPA